LPPLDRSTVVELSVNGNGPLDLSAFDRVRSFDGEVR
jgi:hypothetical protein